MSCEIWRDKLDAYIDGESPSEELAAVEAHLRDCAGCAREALARMQLKRATQVAGHRYAPSPEFRLRVGRSLGKNRKALWSIAWRPGILAVTAALLLIVVSALIFARHTQSEQALAELIDLHIATMASANPVDVVSTDRHTVKPWFQGKLPFSFNLPELANTQFHLVGGKVAYLDNSPAAQLLFTSGKHNVSVFIVQDQPGGPSAALLGGATRSNGFNIEEWNANGLRYIAVSDTNPVDIRALAELLKAAAHS
jgi:anti-sigma factor RsiW